MDGILLFDKPKGWTSHDAVDFVRRIIHQKKVGHAGTLDPMATGLLVLLLGAATKRSQELSGLDKDYSGSMRLGVETDTYDMDGKIISQKDPGPIQEDLIHGIFKTFQGEQEQIPPAYSAIKKDGKKMYELARKGIVVEIAPRKVRIDELKLTHYASPEVGFFMRCSKGTYVRSVCHAVGKKLGCGAALSVLQRERIGPFHLKDAFTKEALSDITISSLEKKIIP